MATKVLFRQPNAPEEYGVALPPAELRRFDFSALDFQALTRAGVEYIRTYYPNEFNDFYASNGVIMMLELVAYVGGVLSQRSDILADESFLPTAQTEEAVIQHLNLINQSIQRATPAIVDVEISLQDVAPAEIRIPAGLRFNLTGPDQRPLYFEVFRAPGDFSSSIIIPAGKRGIITYGIEGFTASPLTVTSAGGANQILDIPLADVLDEPIWVSISTGKINKSWRRVDIIEKSAANDEVFEVRHLSDRTRIVFGDDVSGKAPLAGQVINVTYRTGGGVRGRIAANQLNEMRSVAPQPPSSAAIQAQFRNPAPSSGGTDKETIEQAKKRAPREFATHNSVVTGEDYSLLASQFRHPVYGAVSKAVAVVRTGVDQDLTAVAQKVRECATVEAAVEYMQSSFINRNVVEIYVLAEGPGGVLAKPSLGLRQGLVTFLAERNVLTDELRVYDGGIKPVDITAAITLSRNADAGTTKVAVLDALNGFFDLRNFDMGVGFYLSSLYQLIQNIPGVKFVDIYKPADDIVATSKLGDSESLGVGFNEVVVLGKLDLKFYFEGGNFRVPPVGKI